jgi:2-oxoglutarate dehydrogenase E2 component (dihydrolipoamide succinyltransferase)
VQFAAVSRNLLLAYLICSKSGEAAKEHRRMAIDVVMPQMGESIAEGTVSRWLKKPGDKVERDEPLLEISTDKVDAEIPSPAAGTLSEIVVKEGQTVPVNSVLARIAAEGEAAQPQPSQPASAPAPAAAKPQPPQPPQRAGEGAGAPPSAPKPAPAPAEPAEPRAANAATQQEMRQEASGVAPQKPAAIPQPSGSPPAWAAGRTGQRNATSLDERRRTRSSPLVRKIARENDVDISRIKGSGVSGRVTKNDILEYMQSGGAPVSAPAAPAPAPPRPAALQFAPGETMRIEPLSVMRKKIAQHMIQSKHTSAHVTTVFEIDFTTVERLRQEYKQSYGERGVKLTYLPFIVQAVITALRDFPILNASMDENNVIYHREYNIGIAVALDWGLIVPVVKNADEKNVLGLARAINDLGERARTKRLSPDDVQGGTFTITNPGIYGGLFGMPIINQPQVAILGVGGVKKRPVVFETDDGDFIAIRSMCYLALTFDHRLIDGAVADQFMARMLEIIENGEFKM